MSIKEESKIVKDMMTKELLKENPLTRFKSVLFGADSRILSFLIITPECPMGKKTDASENKKLRERFIKQMKELGHPIMPLKGVYNKNKENSFLVLNPSIEDAKQIGYDYDQEAFIFADRKNFWDDFFYQYYEKPKKGKYERVETVKTISSKAEAEDMFSRFKNFKFSIDFFADKGVVYPECVERFDEYLNKIIVEKDEEYDNLLREQVYEKGFTERHRLRVRHFHLYETKEHRKIMNEENAKMETEKYKAEQNEWTKKLKMIREQNKKYEEERRKLAEKKD